MQQRTVTIQNQRGLHARAAAKVVRLAEQYRAEISISKDEITVNGKSIMGLMMLGAATGTELLIAAEGDEAPAALAALTALIERKFDEE
ncbi:MAG TPA: HPr family phosphocarrier protein [Dongiaceae bacterium]|jgi:phosphocarrier protein|nr:HPr family phosphocarrier protein [Dongiaceae bacterium]